MLLNPSVCLLRKEKKVKLLIHRFNLKSLNLKSGSFKIQFRAFLTKSFPLWPVQVNKPVCVVKVDQGGRQYTFRETG